MFEYTKLGDFTYHILAEPPEIRAFLQEWIGREWKKDNEDHPGQLWTIEWLEILKTSNFELKIIILDAINLRKDLMEYETEEYSFEESLRRRTNDRQESMLRGTSIEPLLVNGDKMELMDGHTRYMVLKKFRQESVYVYLSR